MRRSGLVLVPILLGIGGLAFAQEEETPPVSRAPAPSTSTSASTAPDAVDTVDVVEDEGPKPDAKNGVVSGKLTDAATKEEIIDGQCVVPGTKYKAITDAEGKFSLKLPPGKHQLRCFYEGYKAQRVDNLEIVAGKTVNLAITLTTDKDKPVEEIVVEVDPDRTTPATQLFIRKNAATSNDAISAADIAKTPDRNAAEATRRVVGATLVDGRFIFVRGLGDRYTNSLLNGAPLPSPEPDLQAIPLDIFPVSVLSDVTIVKTFTPDMPADFAGGSVRIQTRSFPTSFLFVISLTGGFNSQSTFKQHMTYEGSRQDWLGIDGGARKIPTIVAQSGGKLGGTDAELERYGEAFNQGGRKIHDATTMPNYGFGITAGDTVQLAGNPFGWILSFGYGRRWSVRDEHLASYEFDYPTPTTRVLKPKFDAYGSRSTMNLTIGGLGTASYQIGKNHRLMFTGLHSGSATDDVLFLQGPDSQDGFDRRVFRSKWVQRQLEFAQLVGEHKLPSLGNAFLRWNGYYGLAKRGEPNNTQSVSSFDSSVGKFELFNDSGLTHFFSRQTESTYGGGLDFTQPLSARTEKDKDKASKLKLGGLFGLKDRKFEARRFRFLRLNTPGVIDWARSDPADALNADTIGKFAYVEENTRTSDTYHAMQGVYAAYLMADLAVTSKLRLVGGERLEYTNLEIVSRDDFALGSPEVSSGYKQTDLLPSIGAIYALTDASNLRAAVTQTIARPQLREVAKFDYSDYFNAQTVLGNPNLKRTLITNLDLRWEMFPTADEVVAASIFYKHFKDPIETAGLVQTGQIARTFQNAKSARSYGIELEGRVGLGKLTKVLQQFGFLGNVTLVDSSVTLRDEQKDIATTLERPMQGQSPFVINAAIDWGNEKLGTRARLSYNVMGKRIDTVGYDEQPNVYEKPRNVIDVTVSQRIGKHLDAKLAVENLLNAPYVFKAADKEVGRWTVGTTCWLSISASY